jgi:peptidoglycan lytic transglycosylase
MRLYPGWNALSAIARCGAIMAVGVSLASCSSGNVDSRYGVKSSTRVVAPGQPVPKGGGTYRVGNPYVIAGRTYVPQENPNYRAEGQASWYGADFQGRLTANGEVFDMSGVSAAHPTLPLPSYARVTNLENRRSVVVRVNDRGPYHDNRVIDVSVRAAKLLGFYDKGVAQVRVEYVGRASLNGSDDTKLAESLRIEESIAPLVRVAAIAPPTLPGHPVLTPPQAPPPIHTAAMIGRGLY